MAIKAVQHCAQTMHEVMPVMMRALFTEMERREVHGITHVQVRAMMILHDHPGASLSVFADHFGTLLPAASKLVDGLVERGYVTRDAVKGDRRRVALSLTPEGESTLALGHAAMLQVLTEQLAPLTEDECAVIEQAYAILGALFRKPRPGDGDPAPR